MRTIKFRGKTKCGKWRYGDIFYNEIFEEYLINGISVLTETVGQFTGLYDINGKEIYEGDILQGVHNGVFFKLVYWDDELSCFALKDDYAEPLGYADFDENNYTVAGNIYDNSELLEVEE